MKALHCADFHIGLNLDAKDFGKGESSRTVEIQNVLGEIADACKDVDVCIVAGDIFNYSFPAPYVVTIAQDFINKVKTVNPSLQMFLIVGNHDFSSVNMKHALQSLQKTPYTNVTIIDKPCNIRVSNVMVSTDKNAAMPLDKNDVNFIFLPYMGRFFDTSKTDSTVASLLVKGIKNILVGHYTATGAQTGSEQYMLRESWDIDAHTPGIDLTLLGHIHKYQVIKNKTIYSGSPVQMDMGEKDEQKGFVMVDTNTMTHSFVPIKSHLNYKVIEAKGIPTLDDLKNANIDKNNIVVVKVNTRRDEAFNLSDLEAYLSKHANNHRFEVTYTDTIQTRNSKVTEKLSPIEAMKMKIAADKPKYAEEIMAIGKKVLEDVFNQGVSK